MISEEIVEFKGFDMISFDPTMLKKLEKSLWRPIARNEIKIRTSALRNHRIIFFFGLYGFLIAWALLLAPILFDIFMPQVANIEELSGIYAPMVGLIIEFSMMMLFLILLIYPMNVVYHKTEIGFKETLLASPATESDIFIGEFMGKMPIYFAVVLIFAPVVIGLINPIISLGILQYIIIFFCIFGLVFLGNLLGTIFASWVEKKIARSEKARDMGKALIMLLTIGLVAIMYALMFFFQFLLENPGLKNWLNFYPSLWYSNVIQFIIDPTLIEAYILNIWTSLILAIMVPVIIMYIAYKKAHKFYSLESVAEKETTTIGSDNLFYRLVRIISGQKWGGLIVIQFKHLLRKKENIARIAYCIGLLGFMAWFMGSTIDDAFGQLLMSTMLTILGGAVFSIMIGHLIFIDTKDLIWVYKRSPRGIYSLIASYFLMLFVLNLIIGTGVTILLTIFLKFDLLNCIFFYVVFVSYAQICFLQTIGIQSISPAFEVKGKSMQSNTVISMVFMQIPIILIIFGMIGLDTILPIEMLRYILLGLCFLVNGVISIPIFVVGLKKLNNME